MLLWQNYKLQIKTAKVYIWLLDKYNTWPCIACLYCAYKVAFLMPFSPFFYATFLLFPFHNNRPPNPTNIFWVYNLKRCILRPCPLFYMQFSSFFHSHRLELITKKTSFFKDFFPVCYAFFFPFSFPPRENHPTPRGFYSKINH